MARMVATKAALSIRVDALTDAEGKSDPLAPTIGLENRAKLEYRLRKLEEEGDQSGVRRFDSTKKQKKFEAVGDLKVYNTAADAVDLVPSQREPMQAAVQAVLDVKEEKRKAKEAKKAKKKAKIDVEVEETSDDPSAMDVDGEEHLSKKEKKRKRRESEPTAGEAEPQVCPLRLTTPDLTLTFLSSKKQKPSARLGKRQRKLKSSLPLQPPPLHLRSLKGSGKSLKYKIYSSVRCLSKLYIIAFPRTQVLG